MSDPARHIIVESESLADRQLAYVLEHIDRRFDELRAHIDQQMAEALVNHTDQMATDSDLSRPYWASGAEHVADHWWGKLSRRGMMVLLGAVGAALLIWLGSLGIVFRGAP